jgi:hypothetical protein
LIRWNGIRWKAGRDGMERKKALGGYRLVAAVAAAAAAVVLRRRPKE